MNFSRSGGYKVGDVARHKEERAARDGRARPAARISDARNARNMPPDQRNVRRENSPGALPPEK
jgi:hypothetical protein